MKIDLNTQQTAALEGSRSTPAASGHERTTEALEAVSQDTAQLTAGSSRIQGLMTQLGSVPDVRQQRVEALRLSMTGGSFRISPKQIAAAMLADSHV